MEAREEDFEAEEEEFVVDREMGGEGVLSVLG